MRHKARRDLILSIDIGTSSLKGGLIDPNGYMVAQNWASYRERGVADFLNWDSHVWIESLRDVVASLGGYESISAVVISGHGPSLVPVDSQGNPLFGALLWLDNRDIRISGTKSFYLSKAAWLKENQPGLYEKTWKFLGPTEFVNYFLTGEVGIITSHSEFTPYLWTPEEINEYRLDPDKFPPLVNMAEIIGYVQKEAGYTTGIPEGTPVIASGSDFLASLLGAGSVEPGTLCDRAGSSEGINFCSSTLKTHPKLRTLPHVIKGLYNISGILSSTGRLFEWFRNISGQEKVSYREMLMGIENTPPAKGTPWFVPALDCRDAMDFKGGLFWGLEPDQGKEHLGRAVVEAIGYSIKGVLKDLVSLDCQVEDIRVTGGQARNVLWNQIKADMTGKVVLVPEIEDAELLGNACVAMVAKKEYATLGEASEDLVRIKARYTPRKENLVLYEEGFQEYTELLSRLTSKLC